MIFRHKAKHWGNEGHSALRRRREKKEKIEREESIQQNLLRQQPAASKAPSRRQWVGY